MSIIGSPARSTGAALAVVLLVLALLAVFIFSAFGSSQLSLGVARRYSDHSVAQAAARAGLARALQLLHGDRQWSAGFESHPLDRSGAACTVTFGGGVSLPHSTNNTSGPMAVKGWDDRTVPRGACHLVSTGVFRQATATAQVLVRTAALDSLAHAVEVDGAASIRDGATDSFNSSVGSYGQTRRDAGCDLISNASAEGEVELGGHTRWNGDVTVGPRGSPSTVSVGPLAELDGSVEVPLSRKTLVAASPPEGSSAGDQKLAGADFDLPPGVYGRLTLSNARLRLSGGSYLFSGIESTGSTLVIAEGSSRVYCYSTEDVLMNDTAVSNETLTPDHFWLIGAGSERVTLELAGKAYLVVYAPTAAVSLTGGNLYGSIVGETVITDRLDIHYDRALLTTSGPNLELEVLGRWGD